MSLSTWPALTFANTRNPREKLLNPIEIISSTMLGTNKKIATTSIVKILIPENPVMPAEINSTILKTITEIKMVEIISTIKVAVITESEKLREKARKPTTIPEIFPTTHKIEILVL